MRRELSEWATTSATTCWVVLLLFVLGLVALAVRLKAVQVDGAAAYRYENVRQSVRRVQTAGPRGRILDCQGRVLAENRKTLSLVCQPSSFKGRTLEETVARVQAALQRVATVVGRSELVTEVALRRHLRLSLPRPLTVCGDLTEEELARFCEHEQDFPGFSVAERDERHYPHGALASHLLGYVGSEACESVAGDIRFSFRDQEMRGRSGLEIYYDSYLRGVTGERKIRVDACGYAWEEWTVVGAQRGLDLHTTIDLEVQAAVERQLRGEKGACVVLDPRDGAILALASAPSFDPNQMIPGRSAEMYPLYLKDAAKPLLNRASGGGYAPGSTFKPITALAALRAGVSAEELYDCTGVFSLGGLRLHCARRWGHGLLAMRQALRESCNTYFCQLGTSLGTNTLMQAARDFGLGTATGIDLGVDYAGVVPDGAWKWRHYQERWYPGDLTQMSIGQGMLLTTPLQMACVAAALGTGFLVTPHVKAETLSTRRKLPFSREALAVVREGMRQVVERGTGKAGGEGVGVSVAGKTGTAEIGRGAMRRKNTWFIAYAPVEAPRVAIAMVIENGQSGGGTTAPKVAEVLKAVFAK